MMRDILVQVGKNQKQLEHAIALFRLRLVRGLFQILDDCEGIGKQPFKTTGIKRSAFAAASQSLVGADKSVVEKMVEAKPNSAKRGRNRFRTPNPEAASGHGGSHHTPQISSGYYLEVRERLTHFF